MIKFLLAIVATLFLLVPAQAQIVEQATSQGWSLGSGVANDGTFACVVDTASPTSSFLIKYYSNAKDVLVIQLFDNEWMLDSKMSYPVEIYFGTHSGWTSSSTVVPNSNNGVEFYIGLEDVEVFVSELRNSAEFVIKFPGTTEPDWGGGLAGLNFLLDNFIECMSVVTQL